MRALTVRQPWAWAIIHGGKDIENRTRNIAGSYRGTVAIHAGLHPFEQHNMASHALRAAHGTEASTSLAFGAIIGTVELTAVHHCSDHGRNESDLCSPWAMTDHWHLRLSDPKPLTRPILLTGRLGLWTPPDDVIEAIRT